MTKDCSAGSDNPERKEWASMPVVVESRHLYPEWETVGEPYMDGERKMVTIRKHIAAE